MSPPALTSAGPAAPRDRGRAVDGVALGDAAEVEPEAGLELDPAAVDPDVAATAPGRRRRARPRPPRRRCGRSPADTTASCTVGSKRPPVRSRASAASLVTARRSSPASMRPDAVERRELRVGAEAGEEGFQPLELVLGSRAGELALGARVDVEEQLDLGAHRGERAPHHHDVLVIVSGGRVTTRTEGAAADTAPAAGADASDARAFAFRALIDAISRLRSASCVR